MRKKLLKIFAGSCPVVAVTALCLYSLINKPFEAKEIFCFANRVTGIKCPSCGVTRAVWCMLHGDFKTAFYYNALFTVGIIPSLIFTTLSSVNYCLENKLAYLPKYGWKYFYTALLVVIAFTVIRNFIPYIY